MYELKKFGKVLTSKSVGTGPLSYEKRIYRAAVSQRLRNTATLASSKPLEPARLYLYSNYERKHCFENSS